MSGTKIQLDILYRNTTNKRRSWCGKIQRKLNRKMYRSAVTMAKITLVFMNIWVLAVVLVVSLGHWRVFESTAPGFEYENSHLVVMRELKEEGDPRLSYPQFNLTKPEPVILVAGPSKVEPPPVSNNQPPPPPVLPKAPPVNERIDTLRRWCQQQHPDKVQPENIPGSKLASILVDEKHKLLYCQVPGVAQNDLRKIMLILTGIVNISDPAALSGGDVYGKYGKSVKRLSEYPDAARGKMIKDFYKILFVRDPLERLLKTYDTKIASKLAKYFHKTFGTEIIKKYRKNAKAEDIKSGSNVKFSEFVQFIIDTEYKGVNALNEHWLQYYKQCHPCLVQYDFLGKFETVTQDIDKVLTKLNVKSKFKGSLVTDFNPISESVLKKQYSTTNAKTLNKLYNVYKADYMLFGYKCPKYMHELMDKEHFFHDY